MKPSRILLRNREAASMARDLLRDRGYDVVRCAGNYSPVDLVAWNHDRPVLIVRTARSCQPYMGIVDLSFRFSREIAALRRISRPTCLSLELWVYYDHEGWRFFSVYRGGIMEVKG